MHPFNLAGTDEVQPAGIYTVQTDEELLRPSSLPAYRRIATLLRLERTTGTVLIQIVETNPVELAGALARDAQPGETVAPAATGGEDRRRLLDIDGAGGRGAGCTCGHPPRLRRHLGYGRR